MLRNRYTLAGGFIAVLLVANFLYYFCSGWGLITVKVQNAPLRQVIKSIEWQGWVKIYSNIDPETKITMYVDHVPLAEAMDTLSTNVTLPPRDRGQGNPGGAPPPPAPANPPAISENSPPPAPAPPADAAPGAGAGGNGNNGPGRRGGGGFGGGFGGLGGGRGVQWQLAFFVAPTATETQAQIRSFQQGGADDAVKIFSYPTPLQMLATDEDFPSADPRLQNWPGMKIVPVSTAPPPAPPADGSAPASPDSASAPVAEEPPHSAQGYLRAIAQSADVYIMVSSNWDPAVSAPPPPNSSLISAVKNLVASARGSVVQAIVLRSGRGGGGNGRGQGRGGFAGGDDGTLEDRLRNAINGLPSEARADALAQLDQEVKFRRELQAAPADQRPTLMRQHIEARLAENPNAAAGGGRKMSPEKRAQRYQRTVSNRMAAQGK